MNPEEENHLDVEENRTNCAGERDTNCTSNRTLTREDKNNRVGASAYAPAPALKRRINAVQAKLEALSALDALEEPLVDSVSSTRESSCPVVRTECDKPTLIDSVSSTEEGNAPAVELNCDKPTLVDSVFSTEEINAPADDNPTLVDAVSFTKKDDAPAALVPPLPPPPPAHEPTWSNHDWDTLAEKLRGLRSSGIVSPRRPAADDELPTKEINLPTIDGPEEYAAKEISVPKIHGPGDWVDA